MTEQMEKVIVTGQDSKDYDFTPYRNPEDIKGYLGFIGPDGSFYKVREITDYEYESPHNVWARNFIEYYHLEKPKDLTSSTTLIKKYGFILSSYQWESFQGERRTYITANHTGVCDEATCEVVLENQNQLDTIRKIRDAELANQNIRGR